MKRLLILAVMLRAAPAAADCVDLPTMHRQVDLPDGWRVTAGANQDELWNDAITSGSSIYTVQGPSPTACADYPDTTDLGWKSTTTPSGFVARYVRFWDLKAVMWSACVDGAGGSYLVTFEALAIADVTDPRLTELSDRLADALTTDVRCDGGASSSIEASPPAIPAPAYGECVTLPIAGRTIQLPANWALYRESEGASVDHLVSATLSGWLSIHYSPGLECAAAGYDDGTTLPGFGPRYEAFGGDEGLEGGCIDVGGGIWTVDKYFAPAERDDPAWLAATEAVADMIRSDVSCGVASGSPSVPRTRPPPFRPDVGAVVLAGTMLSTSYVVTELHATAGGSLGPFAFAADGRVGTGFGNLREVGIRVGAGFGTRTRITATFGIGGRWVSSNESLGLGLRIDVTTPLRRRLRATGSLDVGWRSAVLEYTVPTPRSELGPFELEPGLTAGVGWRFVVAGVEARELREFNNGQWVLGAFAGVRYAP